MSITNSPENRLTSETRTPAQERYDKAFTQNWSASHISALTMERAEEVAASVAALAETVAEQEQTMDDWTHLVHARMETHSHRISQSNSMLVKAVTELCDLVDWLAVGTVHMIGVDACSQINERTAALRALESSASAPEPVCPTCKGENDCQIEARYPNGDGCGYFKDCPDCDGTGFVPVEPTAAVPDAGAALDSMRLALIRLLNMLTLTQVNALGEDDMKLIFGKVGDVQIEEHLQAYGKPGANPKLVVPEKTVAIRAYGRDGAR